MAGTEELHLSFEAGYGAFHRLMHALDRFLEENAVPPRGAYILRLALEELITNIVKYACAPPDPDAVKLLISRAGGRFRVRLAYGGIPFDPVSRPEPLFGASLQERSAGGMGLHLVKHLVEAFDYRRADGKNQLEFFVPMDE